MTTRLQFPSLLLICFTAAIFSACYVDDPGPLQRDERQFTVVDFDRLEMGDGFHIDVVQGSFYEVSVKGDRRNVDDLLVLKNGSTLVVRFDDDRQRRHDTFIKITMPVLHSVNFSGASESTVYGFSDVEAFDVYLSGASVCQLDVDAPGIKAVLSGASYLNLRGGGQTLDADLSGASALKAFNYPVSDADVVISGSSDAEVTATDHLKVVATGASHLIYRGDPVLESEVSGASSVHQD